MEEYRQITLDEWMQWKENIHKKLDNMASDFVYIGYYLKKIRDSGMYDGAGDFYEFAKKEFGIGKSTVSRFIAINEKYSEGGNSLELKEEFRGFSSSKLSEMLTLPDSEVELITEKTTIREIRELKAFDSRMPEEVVATSQQNEEKEAAGGEGKVETPLEKCLIDFFKDKKDMLNSVMEHLKADPPAYKEAAERMAPSQTSHKKGIVFLFMYDWNTGVKYKLMGETEPVSMRWEELLDSVYGIFGACEQDDVWGDFYKDAEQQTPEKAEAENTVPSESKCGGEPVATSQQNEGKEAAGGENKEGGENETQETACADSEQTAEPSVDPESADTEDGTAGGTGEDSAGGSTDSESGAGVAPVQPEDEQLEGQMDISDFPEYMPEKPEKTGTEAESAEAAGDEKSEAAIRDADGLEQHIENQEKIIIDDLQIMRGQCVLHNWDGLIERAHKVIERAEAIRNMEEMWHG